MRSLALIFVIGFLFGFPGSDTFAQQSSASEASREAARAADRMAEDLARTLPTRLTATAVKKSRDVKMATPSQGGDPGKPAQERPRAQVPEDKPLGAAGPSRDRRKPDVEDADFMVIRDRWRVACPKIRASRRGTS